MLKLLVTGAARFATAWVTGGVLRLLVRVLDRQAEPLRHGPELAPGTAVTAEGLDPSVVEAELAGFLHGADAANQLEWE